MLSTLFTIKLSFSIKFTQAELTSLSSVSIRISISVGQFFTTSSFQDKKRDAQCVLANTINTIQNSIKRDFFTRFIFLFIFSY